MEEGGKCAQYSHSTGFVSPLNCSTAVLTTPPPSSCSPAGGGQHCVSISKLSRRWHHPTSPPLAFKPTGRVPQIIGCCTLLLEMRTESCKTTLITFLILELSSVLLSLCDKGSVEDGFIFPGAEELHIFAAVFYF